MKLSLIGINHTTAPVEVRERLAFDQGSLGGALQSLRSLPGMNESFILSTCNRVEVVVAADDGVDSAEDLAGFLAQSRQVDVSWLRQFLYWHEDRDAILHLFRVAASLDSMVLGEPQILGQFKSAYELARSEGTVATVLDPVLTRAFAVAKRVRTETEIGQNAVSVSFAAVELAREIFGSLKGRRVLLVGAGKMSELAARHLIRAGANEILVTNRSADRARAMAESVNGRIIPYENFTSNLTDVDVVITSSGAPHYIITREEMRRVIGARRNRPMFLIDIAVPRNIEPLVNELDNVFLYDIDDLDKVVEANRRGREEESAEAERIVREEVDRLVARLRARQIDPLIVSLQQRLESIRTEEVGRVRGRLGGLSVEQEEAVEALTRGIINKIAHGPMAELRKEAASSNGNHVADVIRRVFRLGG